MSNLEKIKKWNKEGRTSQWVDPQTNSQEKFSIAQRLLVNRPRVLDVGCFTGWFLRYLFSQGIISSGVGIDLDKPIMRVAQAMSPRLLKFKFLPVQKMQYVDEFDAILALDVLEHVLDLSEALRAIHGALKPNGIVIVNLPNENDRSEEHLRFLTKEDILKEWRGFDLNFIDCKDELERPTHFFWYQKSL